MKHLRRILLYTKPYWKVLTFSLVSASLYGIIAAAPAYLLKHTIDDIFIKRFSHLIIPFLMVFILLFALKGLFMYLSSYSMHWVNNKVINDIRSDLFYKVVNFPLVFFQSNSTGKLMSHFLTDSQMIQQAAASAIRDGIRSFFEASCLVGFAIFQNAKLGIVMIVVGPIIGITIKKLGRARNLASHTIQSQIGQISSTLQETFIGIREIKAFNAEKHECNRFRKLLKDCFHTIMFSVHVESVLPALVEAIAVTGCGLLFYIAAYQVLNGVITAGQLSSFVAAVLLAYQPLKKMVNVYSDIQYGLAAAKRVFSVIDQVHPATQNRLLEIKDVKERIVFKEMSFSYNEKTPVFSSINMTIKKGDVVGIVGPSGSGKSTFCDLLLGFINPTGGAILIDNTDITKVSFASLRNQIGYVGQRTFLFNDSILRNVGYARPNATKEQIINACKAAHADEFIQTLPDGYQTIVGENGTLLSGGQKQRLTIARALLKDPQILVLDEATSALDEESEQMIRLAINELKGKKTLFIVSHRPTMLKNVDYVLYINNLGIKHMHKEALYKQLHGPFHQDLL